MVESILNFFLPPPTCLAVVFVGVAGAAVGGSAVTRRFSRCSLSAVSMEQLEGKTPGNGELKRLAPVEEE